MRTYAELLKRDDAPEGSAWGLFGSDDDIGTVSFLTAEKIFAGIEAVRKGRVFNLDCPINAFDPPWSGRQLARHSFFSTPNGRDDYLDKFYLQGTSQIDGLRHIRHYRHGFYNGVPDDEVSPGLPRLGIQRWAERGIVGRGILVDVERYLARRREKLDYFSNQPIGLDLLEETLVAQEGGSISPGDILLIRTGWLHFYVDEASENDRRRFAEQISCPGLEQSRDIIGWLWDNQIAMVVADNPAVEAYPPIDSSPFPEEQGRLMHGELIPLLGFALGELWALDSVAADCAEDGVYEMLIVAKPLNIIGGVGSPPNALAIK